MKFFLMKKKPFNDYVMDLHNYITDLKKYAGQDWLTYFGTTASGRKFA